MVSGLAPVLAGPGGWVCTGTQVCMAALQDSLVSLTLAGAQHPILAQPWAIRRRAPPSLPPPSSPSSAFGAEGEPGHEAPGRVGFARTPLA